MRKPLRVLHVEDSEADAELVLLALKQGEYEVTSRRVDTDAELRAALEETPWDVVIADYSLPQFSAPQALFLTQRVCPDLPFVVVSGTMGEETAVEMMRGGADDYLMKDNLARLVPALESALAKGRLRTERRQAEAALQVSLQHYRSLYNAIAGGVVVEDTRGCILAANETALRILGRSQAAIEGHNTEYLRWGAVHEDGTPFPTSQHPIACTLSTGEAVRDVVMGVPNPQTRELVWLRVNSEPIVSPVTGEVTSAVATFWDITEMKRAEDELRRSEARFRAVFDASAVGIAVTALDGTHIDCNQALLNMLGLSKEQFLRMRAAEFTHPDDLPADPALWRELMAGKRSSYQREVRYLHQAGHVVTGRLTVSLGTFGVDEQIAAITMVEDITERREWEEKLRESRERANFLAHVVENSSLAFGTGHPDGSIRVANAAFCELTGYTAEELREGDWAQGLTPAPWHEIEAAALAELRDTGVPVRYEKEYRRKDGSCVPVELLVHLAPTEPLSYYAFVTDLTERKRAEATNRETMELMQFIVQNDPNAIAVYDRDLRYIAVSNRYLLDYDVKEESIIGRHHYEVFPEMPERWKQIHQRCLAGAIERNDDDHFERLDGSITYNRWECRPWYTGDGEIGGIITYTEVTTERKLAERALQEREALLSGLYENLPSGVGVYEVRNDGSKGADYIVRTFNASSLNIEGLSLAEVVGKSLAELRPAIDDYGLIPVMKQVWETGEPALFPATIYVDEKFSCYYENRVFRLPTGEVVTIYDDVTDRVMAEQALQQSEKRFREMADLMPDMLVEFDVSGQITYTNRAVPRLLGYADTTQALPTSVLDHVVAADRPRLMGRWRKLAEGETVGIRRYDLLHSDGHTVPAEANADAIRDAEGKIVGFRVVLRDITQRLLAQRRLEDTSARLRAVIEASPAPIVMLGPDTQVKLWNPAAERTFGWTAEEMLRPPSASPPAAERGILERVLSQSLETSHVSSAKVRVPCKSGEFIDIVISSGPVQDASGAVLGAIGVIVDVTEQTRIQQALEESERRFRLLYEEAPIPYQSLDAHGVVREVNACWLRALGYERHEVIGRHFGDFLGVGHRLAFEQGLATGDQAPLTGDIEWPLVRKDGTTLLAVFESRMDYSTELEAHRTHSVFQDVTEARQVQAEALRAQKLESLGVLAGGIAHDFNNALLVVMGNLQMARLYPTDTEMHARQLHNAEQACLQARDLTKQLLTFAKGGAPVMQTARIGELVRDTALFALSGSNVRCEFDIDADHCLVNADLGQMNQVINNLVINADQAMPTGGILRIGIANVALDGGAVPLAAGRYVRITVTDEGEGILPDHLEHIFDPYFTTKSSGSGLGLASTYSIVRNHGGHIAVASTPGVGTTFTIHLPCATECVEMEEAGESTIPGGEGKILVMDDEEAVQVFARMVLEELGYTVTVTGGVRGAVEAYAAALDEGCPYHAVVLDLTIRGGPGGKEAIGLLRELDPEVRAIVCSGYSADAVMANYRDYGFQAVVVKPYEVIDLAKTLQRVLEGAGS